MVDETVKEQVIRGDDEGMDDMGFNENDNPKSSVVD